MYNEMVIIMDCLHLCFDIDIKDIKLDTTLSDLNLDEVAIVELFMLLDREYDLIFPDTLCYKTTTIKSIISYVIKNKVKQIKK